MATKYTKRSGDVGIAVNKIQGYLNIFQSSGLITNRVSQDGVFGTGTKMAVQQFQKFVGLPVDGIVGENTWNMMMQELRQLRVTPKIPVASASYHLSMGQMGLDVYKMQEYLNLFTSNVPLKVDGVYGSKTKQAVMQYQTMNNLKKDGVIGSDTWDRLIGNYLSH